MTLSSEFKVNDANQELNTYIDKDENNDDVLYSNTNISLQNSVNDKFNDQNNITLLNYDDAVKKTGKDINQEILSCINWHCEELGEYDNNVSKDDIASEFYLDDNVNYKIYGHPEKWDLNYNQSWGNCGIISVLNILITAGKQKNYDETSLDDYFMQEHLAIENPNDKNPNGKIDDDLDGGTNVLERNEALNKLGVSSTYFLGINFEQIIDCIKNGKAVSLNVCSDILWSYLNGNLRNISDIKIDYDKYDYPKDHQITITGVVFDENDKVVGYYICDSGTSNKKLAHYVPSAVLNLSVSLFQRYYFKPEEKEQIEVYYTIYTDDSGKEYIRTNPASYNYTIENIKEQSDNIDATGNKEENVIKGNNGDNTLKGEDGDDVLIGNEGNDILYGGSDNDVLIAGSAKKGTGEEKEDLSNEELKNLINQKENIATREYETEKKEGNQVDYNELYGEKGNDLLIGDKDSDYLDGGEGDDHLYGGEGYDILVGGEGNDYLNGGDGNQNDVLIAGVCNETNNNKEWDFDSKLHEFMGKKEHINVKEYESQKGGENRLYGGAGYDLLIGDKGIDYLDGGDEGDYIYGGKGNDFIKGGNGNDFLWGGDNDDIIIGGNDNDNLWGEKGDDILIAGDTNLSKEQIRKICENKRNININSINLSTTIGYGVLYGNDGSDILIGTSNNDHLDDGNYEGFPTYDNDYMYGGDGDDHFISKRGNDYLNGGNGFDVYSLENLSGRVSRLGGVKRNTTSIGTVFKTKLKLAA